MITAAVIDTNVLVAGLLSGTGVSPVARILDGMRSGHIRYLLSPALLQEYRAVLLRPRILSRHGLSEGQIDALLAELVANAIWRELSEHDPAPDPGDDTGSTPKDFLHHQGQAWPTGPGLRQARDCKRNREPPSLGRDQNPASRMPMPMIRRKRAPTL